MTRIAQKALPKKAVAVQAKLTTDEKQSPVIVVDGHPVLMEELIALVRQERGRASANEPESIKKASVSSGVPATLSQVEEATSTLNHAIGELHSLISELTTKMEPHLPRHLFDDTEDCKAEGIPSRVPDYSSRASSTVNSINSSTNEVDRAARRVQFFIDNIVV